MLSASLQNLLVAPLPDAKGSFPEDHTQFIGIYLGGESSANCEPIVDWADLILAAGPQFTDYTTGGWTALPTREKSIIVQTGLVHFSDLAYTGIELADFLSALAKKVHANDRTLLEYRQIGGGERAIDQTTNADTDSFSPLSSRNGRSDRKRSRWEHNAARRNG
jgi:pyruvate decarboxylase